MKLQTLALAAGLMISGGAHAITSVSYDLPLSYTQPLGDFGASIEWVAGISVSGQGTIDHSLTFNITENLFAGSGISDFPLSFTIGNVVNQYKNITGLKAKTCKCHSMALLTAARAQAAGIPYTVQDLTNPGLSLLHSVGLGARLHPLMGVEANSRQYYPDTSFPEAVVHPDIVRVKNGVAQTGSLRGAGLGYQVEKIERKIFRKDEG